MTGVVFKMMYISMEEESRAGRLYDKMHDTASGTVLYVLPKGVLCVLNIADGTDSEHVG